MSACRACGLSHGNDDAASCPRTGTPSARGPCGTRIDRYEVLEWIGGGGMGAVYRARHVGLRQLVAVKLLRAERAHDAETVQRFLREAKAAASIASPHVVQVSDFGVSGEGQPFLVMELLDGVDLDRHLTRKKRLGPDEAVGIVLDVLAGLEAAHAAGVVHRDLKAANVVLAADAVKITDFGISKVAADVLQGTLTRTGMALGTPFAMAPEQARNAKDVDLRADLWAVGVLLYQALSGRRPFEGSSYEDLLVRICTEEPPALGEVSPDVPAPLAAVVMRALEKDRERRWGSASELATALRQAMRAIEAAAVPVAERDEEDAPAPVSEGPGLRPSLAFADARPRNAWKLPLALIGFVAAAGGLLWMALVLRPVAPAAAREPAAAALAAPGPPPSSYHDVSIDPIRPVAVTAVPSPAAPAVSASPASVEGELPSAATIVDLDVRGGLPHDEVERRVRQQLFLLEGYRGTAASTVRCEVDVAPNGNPVRIFPSGGRECAAVFLLMRFREAPRPTQITLDLLVPAKGS